jgi:hypothetical protein
VFYAVGHWVTQLNPIDNKSFAGLWPPFHSGLLSLGAYAPPQRHCCPRPWRTPPRPRVPQIHGVPVAAVCDERRRLAVVARGTGHLGGEKSRGASTRGAAPNALAKLDRRRPEHGRQHAAVADMAFGHGNARVPASSPTDTEN